MARKRKNNRFVAFVLLIICIIAVIIYLARGSKSASSASHSGTVEINEVMSSNKGTLTDEFGNAPDWIELHNLTSNRLDISGFGLSDDLLSAAKWTFPSGTVLEPDGYIVVFCSGDSAGQLHTGFRLSSGDSVILSSSSGSVIDSVALEPVGSGLSLGRIAGNTSAWSEMQPSPGYPNSPEGIEAFKASQSANASDSIGVYINEFMPSNASTIIGPDGTYCDWVELYNTTGQAIDLSGYGISDTPSLPLKYTLPRGTRIEAYSTLLIFCTGRETPAGAEQVEAPFGLSSYRESVVFSTPSGKILDSIDYTRAATDVSFARVPDGTGSFTSSSQPTPGYRNDNAGLAAFLSTLSFGTGELVLSEAMNANYSYLKQPGDLYYDWVEVHNNTPRPISLNGYSLSNNANNPAKWSFPDITLEGNEYLAVLCSGRNITDAQKKNSLETNFKLSGAGDSVFLFGPDAQLLDKLPIPKGRKDISVGRTGTTFLYYDAPTPNEANSSGVPTFADAPSFDTPAGCYTGSVAVSIRIPEGCTVTYTTDGSEPTQSSNPYSGGSLALDRTAVLRARAFREGAHASDIVSSSYIVATGAETLEDHASPGLSVMSIVTDPKNLWDPDIGIYVVGSKFAAASGEDNSDHFTIKDGMNNPNAVKANFWQEWERPAHFDLIGENGALEYSSESVIRVFGAFSRAKEQKGLSLIARSGYGDNRFEHAFFDSRPYTSYKALVLRASAQDATNSKIRDIVITSLLGDHDLGLKPESRIAVQAYRQLVVYLNGSYWGVYNLREKINCAFLCQHYGIVNDETIDILMGNGNEKCVIAGNGWKDYTDMVEWAASHDMSNPSNYEYICSLMDVENFAAYTAAEIIVGNTDTGNIKYWRSTELDNKWRWLFYDFCWAMNRNDDNSDAFTSGYRRDFYSRYFDEKGHGTGKSTSTKLIRALLKNAEFRSLFLEKTALMINEVFTPEKIIARVDECQEKIRAEMVFDVDKWDNINYKSWQNHCDNIRAYANNYQDYSLKYVQAYFSLSDNDMMRIFGRKSSLQ